jgi:biotin transporter BioY
MYIIAIGWLYVVLMMAITAKSFTAGLLTFLLYGLAPAALFLWLVGIPVRKRRDTLRKSPDQPLHARDGTDPEPDQ